ncbi:hypothetical protein FNV43_RR19490 [Rhamnella rubrinervis]|uniref:Cytochrome P450 n=1 Tax=Rhamnella rubrinervis TaxID=2594499 RepID=A0A8K0DXW4_9ROSA|nr:hypothetical protein FNV43_RR19490 [Rhamnella rubrinervis]
MFLWKVLHYAIPVRMSLMQRKIINDASCPICLTRIETIEHLFLDCPWTQVVWFGSPLQIRMREMDTSHFGNWLNETFQAFYGLDCKDKGPSSLLAYICWFIWKERNNLIFNHKPVDPHNIISKAWKAYIDFSETIPFGSPSFLPDNYTSNQCGASGVLIRDHVGIPLIARDFCFPCSSVTCAEALAILMGITTAQTLGLKKMKDSLCCRNGSTSGKHNLPPSPPRLPLIGNLHQLGSLPHRSLRDLAHKYGQNLMLLYLGQVPTLVISSAEMAREMVKNHDIVFSNRPRSTAPSILLFGCEDVGFSPYGETMIAIANNIVSRCVLGKSFMEEDGRSRIGELSRQMMLLFGAFSVGDFFPGLKWIDVARGLLGRMKATFRELDEHKLNRNGMVNGRASEESKSYEESPRRGKKSGGEKSKIDMEDINQMSYFKCVIKENLRLHPPVALLVPRETSTSVEMGGYHIPAKAQVFVNAWAIQRDPSLWGRPEEFMPERFENSSVDFKGQDFEYIPFGVGRRGCPGMAFGVASTEYVIANLLYWFDWKLPGGALGEDLDMSEAHGLTVSKKLPFHLLPTPYSP